MLEAGLLESPSVFVFSLNPPGACCVLMWYGILLEYDFYVVKTSY